MVKERETIVTDTRGDRGSGGIIAIVAILALLIVLFLVFGRGLLNGSGTQKVDADIKIDTPAKS
jgi:hypothetical protein